MITTFIGALELGEIVRVDDAWCPNHGRVRPEGLRFPFTASQEVFLAMQPDCPVCGARIQLDASPADAPMDQHVLIHTDHLGTRVAVDVLPRAGAWSLGITPSTPDQPSGAADV